MANDPTVVLNDRVRAVQRWLTSHGGAIDESDPDAQRDFVQGFLLPLMAEAWAEGFQHAADLTPMGFAPDGPNDRDNPYVLSQDITRPCCGVPIDHDHGDCDGYIFTAADYWRGVNVAIEEEAAEHLHTLYHHGIYKDHCNGYEVHAWPCYPASVMLSDLRELVGPDLWLRTDFFGASPRPPKHTCACRTSGRADGQPCPKCGGA